MARCTGLKRDLRLSRTETYANYYYLNFRSYIGQHGDCYDRFLIRMNEMAESLNIINQCINKITKYNYITNSSLSNSTNIKNQINPHIVLNYLNKKYNNNSYNSMEELISHFKY
jgi:NADH:ubiquinone oxidoreductase subunit D